MNDSLSDNGFRPNFDFLSTPFMKFTKEWFLKLFKNCSRLSMLSDMDVESSRMSYASLEDIENKLKCLENELSVQVNSRPQGLN